MNSCGVNEWNNNSMNIFEQNNVGAKEQAHLEKMATE